MKRIPILIAAVAVATAVGCGPKGADFRDGFPTADTVKLEVPGQSGQALGGETGQKRQEVKGARSDFYALTRGVTAGVNGGVGLVLGLVKAITDHPATTVNGNTAVWGPHTEDLSPNTWKLTVTRLSAQSYEYKLEGKDKTLPDTAFVTVISGTHSPALDPNGDPMPHFGAGTFTLDWDAAQTLPEHDANVGKAEVTYSRLDPSADITIDVVFTQVKDAETGALVDAAYKYRKHAQQGGEFEFSINKDVDDDATRTAIEHLTIRSRWLPSGAGRADVKATQGDLGSGSATANECWDTQFNSQYLTVSWDPSIAYGTEATDCVFATADYSNL